MAKKAIAAVLLVAIGAWAEMAMAPMLLMHAGHMRPGHEMAADMPAEHLGHHHAERAQMSGHLCCPRHTVDSEAALALMAGSPACDDPHSCCFRQGPQSVPVPVDEIQTLAGGIAPAHVAMLGPQLIAASRAIDRPASALPPSPGLFGMTLRV